IEVEISITRRNGFADSLQIVAENLPSGVSSEPVLSKPKGDSAKSVKLILKVQEAASTQSAFRITAQPIDAEGNLISAKQFATYPLRPTVQLDNFWLTISQPKPN
ncbi:serine protease, partial [bacterium]|nr:serine protease [bacterium]